MPDPTMSTLTWIFPLLFVVLDGNAALAQNSLTAMVHKLFSAEAPPADMPSAIEQSPPSPLESPEAIY
jgi:hypothetical protein